MASTKVTEEAISLPAGPVDFDKLTAAIKAGKTAEQAVTAATKDNPVPQQVEPDLTAPVVAETDNAVNAASSEKE